MPFVLQKEGLRFRKRCPSFCGVGWSLAFALAEIGVGFGEKNGNGLAVWEKKRTFAAQNG